VSSPRFQTPIPKGAALLALLAACLPLQPRAASAAPAALPRYVLGPPPIGYGACFRELFDHPDEWAETRSHTDCLLYADHHFNIFADADLARFFAQMKKWNLKLELEVGAVKEWKGQTGESTFKNQAPMWDRIQRLGGNIYSLAFDEPLCNVREYIHKPDEYAIEETAKFIALVRDKYPQLILGDIEPYPSIPMEDHIKWIAALRKRLAEMKVKGLDFYRMDVDWNTLITQHRGNWGEVKRIQDYCQSTALPFSLIYWAANYGAPGSDDSTWYVGTMSQGYAYASVRGAPQQYVMESWVDGPSHSVPETADFTFTRTARDFDRRFVKVKD